MSVQASVVDNVPDLSDLELAVLLSLVANHHCVIETDEGLLDNLEAELTLVAARVFGLSFAVVNCTENTTLDDFSNGILVDDIHDSGSTKSPRYGKSSGADYFQKGRTHNNRRADYPLLDVDGISGGRKIANVVIAKNLDRSVRQTQIQALELLRTRRVFTRTAIHVAPERFLFIALLTRETPGPRLVCHLNDHMFMSHYHPADNGFPNLEEAYNLTDDDADSTSSVVRNSPLPGGKRGQGEPLFSKEDIDSLMEKRDDVVMSAEVKRYLQNIAVFLRMHRAVAGGVSAWATKHFELLANLCICLAPIHSMEYVTPSLVALAARKVYTHRITVTTPENERSMQWGSDLSAIRESLEGISSEEVVEEVLRMVEVPL